jgi:hypothetical protein
VANQVLRRARVPRDDDSPAGSIEAKPECGLHGLVIHQERGDAQAVPRENHALIDLSHAHPGRLTLVHVCAANLDVPVPERQEPVNVGGRARRAENLERRVLSNDPSCQHEMAEVDHVIGVEMGEEDAVELARQDPGAEHLDGHSGTSVHEERLASDTNEGRGTAT